VRQAVVRRSMARIHIRRIGALLG